MGKYALGLDFGTLDAQEVLFEVRTGEELATALYSYPDGLIDEDLPDGKTKLVPNWALQNPEDYIKALSYVIPE